MRIGNLAFSGKSGPLRRHFSLSRMAVVLLVIMLAIGMTVGATIAYLVDRSDALENRFTYGHVTCEVQESFNGHTKSNVQIKNTGDTSAYMRATYVVNWVDENGDIVGDVPEGYSYSLTENPNSQWTVGDDGYFYYLTPVAPGSATPGSLLNCTVTYPVSPEYHLSVEILATAIQSEPVSAVTSAWGVTPSAD